LKKNTTGVNHKGGGGIAKRRITPATKEVAGREKKRTRVQCFQLQNFVRTILQNLATASQVRG